MVAAIIRAKKAFELRLRDLVVTFMNGDELRTSMGRSAKVPALKLHISGKQGIPVGQQELFIVGSTAEPELPLADDRTIDDAATEAGLSANATIPFFVSVRSPGS